MVDLVSHVESSIATRSLLTPGDAVLVAVSGGVDSMVLLDVLHRLAARHRWRLALAHLNHSLRGRSSDADATFVHRIAEKFGLECHLARADVRGLQRTRRISLEMAARQARHLFLARTARALNLGTIALAHHADDQVELFLLRLLRGAGGEGMSGMKWSGPSVADRGIQIIRPLLDQPKSTLLAYAARHRLRFRPDASNADVEILRNRIRHRLLPLLIRDYQPSFVSCALRTMDIIGADGECVAEIARHWLSGAGEVPFETLAVAVQRQCIRLQLIQAGIEPEFSLVESLRVGQEVPVSAGRGRRVVRRRTGKVELIPEDALPPFGVGQQTLHLEGKAGKAEFGGLRIGWKLRGSSCGGAAALRKQETGCERFDADRVGNDIILRHWRPGDRFQPVGMPRSVKLQDLFTNARIPTKGRREAVVATTEKGGVFWVEGLRIGARFKLDKGTRRRLEWRWQRTSGTAVA